MRIHASTRLFLLRNLIIGVLLVFPVLGSYVVFTANSVTEQVAAATLQDQEAAPTTVATIADPAPEAAPVEAVAAAPAPVAQQQAPTAIAAAPAPAVDRILIPSVGVNSSFVPVGLASNGAVDVPASTVGWWNGSAQPGTKGAAFFDGHTPGALSALAGVSVGSVISVQKADGQVFNYTIVYRETVALSSVDMRKALRVYGAAAEGLNLMTCAGTYIPSMGTTDQRLIVYAVRS